MTTAVVLGGFFVFVCLLVVYKTKLKPMWRERQARKHDTAAHNGVARPELSSHQHSHKGSHSSCSLCVGPEIGP